MLIFVVFSLLFMTPFYKTSLYGGEDLLEYFSNNLQEYNQLFFILAIYNLLFYVYLLIVGYKKYLIGIYNLIIILTLACASLFGSVILLVKLKPIYQFFENYDFSLIQQLEGFNISWFWKNINYTVNYLMIISLLAIICITINSYIQYRNINRRGVKIEER